MPSAMWCIWFSLRSSSLLASILFLKRVNAEGLGGGLGGSSVGKAKCVLDWVVFEELVGDGFESRGVRSLQKLLGAILLWM